MFRSALKMFCMLALACGGESLPFRPMSHLPFPQLSPHSGRRLETVDLVTVTFQDCRSQGPSCSFDSDVQAFGDFVPASNWFAAVATEYGVTQARHLQKTVLADEAAATSNDTQLRQLLTTRIADGHLPLPTLATLYLLYLPAAAKIDATSLGLGVLCEGGFRGYHQSASYNGAKYAYAVIGNCNGVLAEVTGIASHEIIEAATDPELDAWNLDVPTNDPWYALYRDEVADLCEMSAYVTEGGFNFQRSWSNDAARGGGAPCVPLPPGEIFQSVSAAPNQVALVAPGQTTSFTLTGWSSARSDEWPLLVLPGPNIGFQPTWKLSANQMTNGRAVTLTVGVPAGTASGQVGAVLVYSGPQHLGYWPVTLKAN